MLIYIVNCLISDVEYASPLPPAFNQRMYFIAFLNACNCKKCISLKRHLRTTSHN